MTDEDKPIILPDKRWRSILLAVLLTAAVTAVFYLAPDGDAFHFTVLLETEGTQTISLPDPVRLKLSEKEWLLASPDWKGRTAFENIPGKYRNKPVTVVIDHPKWRFHNGTTEYIVLLKDLQVNLRVHLDRTDEFDTLRRMMDERQKRKNTPEERQRLKEVDKAYREKLRREGE